LSPERTVLVGDSRWDIEDSHAAGSTEHQLRQSTDEDVCVPASRADVVIDSIRAIASVLIERTAG
jgi:phosphoglycolate phosphatase-like HAD superfamily hydrolase